MSREKDLVKNTAIIAVGKISTQFISFFLLPLYTACLSTIEYGEVDLNNTIRSLLIPIVTLMIDQAIYVYMIEAKGDKKQNTEIITTGLSMTTLQCVIFCIVFCLLSPIVNIPYKNYLCLNIVAAAYAGFMLQAARGLRDVTAYSLGGVITSAVTIILNVICIAYLNLGARGMLIATFIGNVACVLFVFFRKRLWTYLKWSRIEKSQIKEFLKYSLPLIPNQLSIWLISASDRLIVSAILGNHFTGILAVVHKFPQVFSTAFNIFHISWTETVILHIDDKDSASFLSDTISNIIRLFASMAIGINCVVSLCFTWLIHENYMEAYNQIPINMLAILCNVVVGLLGAIYVARKATSEVAKTTIFSGLINVITHFLLIKFIGLYAASVSTFLGYAIMMVYRYIDVQRFVKIKIHATTILQIIGLYILSVICYYSQSMIVRLIGTVVLVCIVLWLNQEMLKAVIMIFAKKVKKN